MKTINYQAECADDEILPLIIEEHNRDTYTLIVFKIDGISIGSINLGKGITLTQVINSLVYSL